MNVKRKLAALPLAFLLLLPSFACLAEERVPMPKALYVGIAQTNIHIRAEQSREAKSLGHYTSGSKVQIIGYDPEWLTVVKGTERDWVTGYVLRHTVSEITMTSEAYYPYGATPAAYTADITRDVILYTEPDSKSDPIFMLTEGSKVAILEIKDGWAKLIYWRQYGYFYLDAVDNLTPVYDADSAESGDVIAAFMSFYNLSQEGLNPNRMVNIAQACDYISITIQPGEEFAFDSVAGPYRQTRGYLEGVSYFEGQAVPSTGGGVCQVSSTLYNVLLALPDGMEITYRRAHGPSGATYLPHGVDAAVGNDSLNLVFVNRFSFPVTISTKVQDGALYIAMHK